MHIEILITLGIFLVTQIVVTVWWASRVNTLLGLVQEDVKAMALEFKASSERYVRKEDCVKHLSICEKEHGAIWKKLDKIEQVT